MRKEQGSKGEHTKKKEKKEVREQADTNQSKTLFLSIKTDLQE
jgi:hypothetical protein